VRIVLDSNIVIAAFAARGLCNTIVETCIGNHEIILCEAILEEISEKLRKEIRLPGAMTKQVLTFLRAHTTSLVPDFVDPRVCRDKKDLMVLGTALAGKVNSIVTGDKDLLAIGVFHGIEIIDPRSFWNRMRENPA